MSEPRRCTAHAAWGCFPGVAPRPPGGPVRYHCTLTRGHRGDHVVEVAGHAETFPRLERGRPRAEVPLTERVMVRFTREDVEQLERARQDGEAISAAVRRLALR